MLLIRLRIGKINSSMNMQYEWVCTVPGNQFPYLMNSLREKVSGMILGQHRNIRQGKSHRDGRMDIEVTFDYSCQIEIERRNLLAEWCKGYMAGLDSMED